MADVERRAADFAWAEVVVCSLEVPLDAVRRALEIARAQKVTTIVNPAPFPDAGIDFLTLADYVTPNEGEAARLAGLEIADLDTARKAAGLVRARGAGTAVLTLGAGGALADGAGGVVARAGVRGHGGGHDGRRRRVQRRAGGGAG